MGPPSQPRVGGKPDPRLRGSSGGGGSGGGGSGGGASILDPIRELNNYLNEIHNPENLIPFLQFSTVQSGPNSQAIHTATYTFYGIVVGIGTGTTISSAKRNAATHALLYFRTQGIPVTPPPFTFHISVG